MVRKGQKFYIEYTRENRDFDMGFDVEEAIEDSGYDAQLELELEEKLRQRDSRLYDDVNPESR